MSGLLHLRVWKFAMNRMLRYWPLLVLFISCLAVYWVGLGGSFFFDDYPNLVSDPDWRITSLTLSEVMRAMGHGIASDGGRPLALLSFGLNHYFTGMAPMPMKLTNLLIHAASALLVFQLCLRLFELIPHEPSARAMPGRLAALAISLAWALHPLQVSSVLYIVQRMELASQFFVLMSLLVYIRARRNEIAGMSSWHWLIASLISMLLGLGFKESAILAPAFALLIELTLLRFRGPGNVLSKRWLTIYAVGVGAACLLFMVLILPRYLPDSAYSTRNFTLSERLWTQIPVLGMYLSQFFFPLPDRMPFYYDNFPISRDIFSSPSTTLSAIVLLTMVGTAIGCMRRLPLVTLGIGWFFVAHALTSNVIPLELAFEHRNYLALFGLLLALSQPLAWVGAKLEPDSRVVMTLLPVVLLAGLCHLQARTWSDPFLLATSLASRAPDSPRASYDLGTRLMLSAGNDFASPQWSMAKKEFEHAAQLPSLSILPEQALIIMSARDGEPAEQDVWMRLGNKLTAKQAGVDEINGIFALVDFSIRNPGSIDGQQLFNLFQIVLERNPTSVPLLTQYGNFAWNILRDRELAIRMQRDAVRLAPNDLQGIVGLAKYLLASGMPDYRREGELLWQEIRDANRDGRFDSDLESLEVLRSPGSTQPPDRNPKSPAQPAAAAG